MDPGSVDKAAAALPEAYATGTPIPPLTAGRPEMSADDAYAVFAGLGSVTAAFGAARTSGARS
jgi:2-keto-4-pentenoate hydratase